MNWDTMHYLQKLLTSPDEDQVNAGLNSGTGQTKSKFQYLINFPLMYYI